MGTPVPVPIEELESAKWYCCRVSHFFQPPPDWKLTCEDPYIGNSKCCRTGHDIKVWWPGQCLFGFELCAGFGGSQRASCLTGPYDTELECMAVC